MKNKEIDGNAGNYVWRDDGIFQHTIRAGLELGIDHVKEGFACHAKITGNRRTPLLIDIRNVKSISQEARRLISNPTTAAQISAVAMLVESAISRVIGIFLIGPNRPSYPVKIFTSEKKAVEWLTKFL